MPSFAAPPSAGELLEQQKQLQPAPTPKPQESIPEAQEAPKRQAPAAPKADTPVKVSEFVIVGQTTVSDDDQLQAFLAPYVGQTLTLGKLFEITDGLSDLYHEKGYMLASVYLPVQDVTEGVITIRVEEGRRDGADSGIRITGQNLRIDQQRIRKTIERAIPLGKPLNKADLERAILLIRDLPGVGASANLEKGSQIGTTSIVADINEGPVFAPWAGVDNSGGRITGTWRTTVGADINDPFGHGGHGNLNASQTQGAGDMQFFHAAYDIPIGYDGLRAGLALNHLTYAAGKELAASGEKGKADDLALNASYPFIRSRAANLWATGAADFKTLNDQVEGSPDNRRDLVALRLGVNVDYTDQVLDGGFSSGDFMLHAGDLKLRQDILRALDQSAAGPRTDGTFAKLTAHLRRVQRNFDNFFLIGDLQWQRAGKNLDSSEKFQLGGPYGVRAYPSGEGLGDDATRINLEAHYVFGDATPLGDLRLIGFYDWGHVAQYHRTGDMTLDTPNRYSLSGYGLGVNVGRPGKLDINLFWARRIGDNPGANPVTGKDNDGSKDLNRFWLSATVWF